jgi:glucose/arabinose dehydrogenase
MQVELVAMPRKILALAALALVIAGCDKKSATTSTTGGCDPTIKLPPGFCATIFADSAGPARHIVVRKNGDVIVGILDQRRQTGGVLMLRDGDKDGHANDEARFGESGVHGVVLEGDSTLLTSTANAVIRYRLSDSLGPKKRIDTLITGLATRQLPSHSLAIDFRGNLIVNVGAASNGCALKETAGAAGRDPCPELETSGGLWSFKTDKINQTIKDGVRIATGLHNAVAIAVNPGDTMIYAASHDRDGLHDLWPNLYSTEESATLPAEELVRIQSSRADFGWPYCYYDYLKQERKLAPEYGGDKARTDRCDRLIQPLVVFPAHWSPMSMVFYTGKMFPDEYHGGAFIAFHGSSQRAPIAEEGYAVVFQQFKQGLAADYTVFASGFNGAATTAQGAAHRPTGLAQGPDGALFLSDDKGGRIWKITYKKP